MKKKSKVIILIISTLLILAAIYYKFYTISEDFSAINGISAIARLSIGAKVVELEGNNSETVLMARSNIKGNDAIIANLQSKGYTVKDRMGAALFCEKNGEHVAIMIEMYTGNYIVYLIPNE